MGWRLLPTYNVGLSRSGLDICWPDGSMIGYITILGFEFWSNSYRYASLWGKCCLRCWRLWADHPCSLFWHNLCQSPLLWFVILEKLDDKIFLVWKQVEHAPKGHTVQHFVVNQAIPMCFLSEDDYNVGCINLSNVNTNCEKQDQLLLHGYSHHFHLPWGRLPWPRWFYFWPYPFLEPVIFVTPSFPFYYISDLL
jgi:hypothetical protein